jgi:hypothetical protein
MSGLFLAADSLGATSLDSATAGGLLAGLMAVLFAFFIISLIIGVAVWIYTSLAFMAIGRKAKYSSPGIAWIPGIGPLIIAYKTSGMPSWPWFLLLSIVLLPLGLIPIVGILIMLIYTACMLTFGVFAIIWQWKLFEAIGKPGWWVLMAIIPFVGPIIYLILLGIAAWSKQQ